MTPTARALAIIRKGGGMAAVVEKYVQTPLVLHAAPPAGVKVARFGIRRDVWGFGDILAVRPEHKGALLLQVTSIGGLSARVRKAKQDPSTCEDEKERKAAEERKEALILWITQGNRAEIWGISGTRVRRFLVSYRPLPDGSKEVVTWEAK